jgi:hypothetical protein
MAIFFLLSCQCSPETKLKISHLDLASWYQISLFLELLNQKLTLLKRVNPQLRAWAKIGKAFCKMKSTKHSAMQRAPMISILLKWINQVMMTNLLLCAFARQFFPSISRYAYSNDEVL